MFAVIETGNQQFIVSEGTVISVEKLDQESGSVVFNNVLLVSGNGNTEVGQPTLSSFQVKGNIVKHFRDDKVIAFKYKAKTGKRLKQGHRQSKTLVKIESIDSVK
jgi:large subunit ribosomal protein L21